MRGSGAYNHLLLYYYAVKKYLWRQRIRFFEEEKWKVGNKLIWTTLKCSQIFLQQCIKSPQFEFKLRNCNKKKVVWTTLKLSQILLLQLIQQRLESKFRLKTAADWSVPLWNWAKFHYVKISYDQMVNLGVASQTPFYPRSDHVQIMSGFNFPNLCIYYKDIANLDFLDPLSSCFISTCQQNCYGLQIDYWCASFG